MARTIRLTGVVPAITIAIVIIVILLPTPIRSGTLTGVGYIGRPFVAAGQWLRHQFSFGQGADDLRQENARLQQQVTTLSLRLSESQQKLELDADIRAITSAIQPLRRQTVTAPVVTINPEPGVQSVVIQAGQDQGVRAGLAVIGTEGVMIGKVQKVLDTTSVVLLLTDTQVPVAARLQNEAQSPGLIRGERGLSLTMQFIPKNDQVQVGQTVVTAGTEANIPPDILIGTVERSSSRAGDIFQTAIISSPVQFNRIKAVAVILP